MSQPASAPRIATIVEGHGEVEAVPVLLRRIAEEIMPAAWPTILRPYRVGRDALLRGQGVETEVDNLLRRHGNVTGLLVLLDADDDCPTVAGQELLERFVHLHKEKSTDGRPRKTLIFPRYHQWDVVTKLTDHVARHGAGHNYLVMASAGSGKSNTIAWLAHRLSSLHTFTDPAALDPEAVKAGLTPGVPVFDKVVVITDRRTWTPSYGRRSAVSSRPPGWS